jgi:hypothetical protein
MSRRARGGVSRVRAPAAPVVAPAPLALAPPPLAMPLAPVSAAPIPVALVPPPAVLAPPPVAAAAVGGDVGGALADVLSRPGEFMRMLSETISGAINQGLAAHSQPAPMPSPSPRPSGVPPASPLAPRLPVRAQASPLASHIPPPPSPRPRTRSEELEAKYHEQVRESLRARTERVVTPGGHEAVVVHNEGSPYIRPGERASPIYPNVIYPGVRAGTALNALRQERYPDADIGAGGGRPPTDPPTGLAPLSLPPSRQAAPHSRPPSEENLSRHLGVNPHFLAEPAYQAPQALHLTHPQGGDGLSLPKFYGKQGQDEEDSGDNIQLYLQKYNVVATRKGWGDRVRMENLLVLIEDSEAMTFYLSRLPQFLSWEEAQQALVDYFMPNPGQAFSRLAQIRQEGGESVADYYSRFHRVAVQVPAPVGGFNPKCSLFVNGLRDALRTHVTMALPKDGTGTLSLAKSLAIDAETSLKNPVPPSSRRDWKPRPSLRSSYTTPPPSSSASLTSSAPPSVAPTSPTVVSGKRKHDGSGLSGRDMGTRSQTDMRTPEAERDYYLNNTGKRCWANSAPDKGKGGPLWCDFHFWCYHETPKCNGPNYGFNSTSDKRVDQRREDREYRKRQDKGQAPPKN